MSVEIERINVSISYTSDVINIFLSKPIYLCINNGALNLRILFYYGIAWEILSFTKMYNSYATISTQKFHN